MFGSEIQEGISKVFVGSGQEFYRRLGLQTKEIYSIWEKSILNR